MSKLKDTIAQAIKDADKSFFNENYMKQADNVLAELRKAGYEIVPLKPPPALVQYVIDNLPFGRLKPTELVNQLYSLIVDNVRKHGG
jgi:predicted CoA-binding protein